MALATDVYEEGWLIVPIKWYALEDKDRRGYKLLNQKRYIVVNAMIRLGGLRFERELPGRAGGAGLSFLGLNAHNLLADACDGAFE